MKMANASLTEDILWKHHDDLIEGGASQFDIDFAFIVAKHEERKRSMVWKMVEDWKGCQINADILTKHMMVVQSV